MAHELLDGSRYRHNYPPAAVYIIGENIPGGAGVCQSRNSNNRVMMAEADNPDRMPCIGVLLESKLLGQEGLVIPTGMMPNLYRMDDFEPGDDVYISTTRGKFTGDQPESGEIQKCGVARNASSALMYCVPAQIPVSEGYVTRGNHTIEIADDTDEVKFAGEGDPDEYSVPHHGYLWISFDVTALIPDAPITCVGRLYHMIDGTNLKEIGVGHVLVNTDETHLLVGGPVASGKTIQVSLQVSKAVGGARAIPHSFIQGP